MTTGNVQSSRGVTLVGAGNPSEKIIRLAIAHAPIIAAADGGANTLHALDLMPSAAIGDFDSLDPATRAALPETRFIHVSEQDSTDFEKSLTRIDAPFVLATGFTAARLDHTLAALSVLARKVGPPTFLLSEEDVIFAAPRRLDLDVKPGTRVSLIPMQRVEGRSKGLRWPIDGVRLDPMGQSGASNEATGPVSLEFEGPGCLVILPISELSMALTARVG